MSWLRDLLTSQPTKAVSSAEYFVVTTFKRSVKALVSKIGKVGREFAAISHESRRLDHSGKTGRTGGDGIRNRYANANRNAEIAEAQRTVAKKDPLCVSLRLRALCVEFLQ